MICEIFRSASQGGMRRSKRTNTLVLISDHTNKNPYQDRWLGGILLYTGMGLVDNQSFQYRQNKTLSESNFNGVEVHLFEVLDDSTAAKYVYQGVMKLAGRIFMARQPDANGNLRDACIFPLKKI